MRYLGIDYGNSHIGLAFAEGSLAEPLGTLKTSTAFSQIRHIVDVKRIEEVVIGDCSEQFFLDLQQLGVPVHKADETLSSYDARQALMHTTQKKRRENEHAVAAAIILQNWLDSHPQSG